MTDRIVNETQDGTVLAALNYMIDTGDKPVTDLAPPGERLSVRTGLFEEREVAIRNARPIADRLPCSATGAT